jgi:hypothetical protein
MADTSQRQGATSFLQDLWTGAVLKYAEVNYRLRNAVTDFTSLTNGGFGENINIPTLSSETAVDYTGIDGSSNDTAVTFTNDTDGQVTINCNKQPAVAKRISDIVATQSSFDIFDGMAKSMAQGVSKSVESGIKAVMVADTTNDVQLGADTSVTDAEYEVGVQGAIAKLLAKDCPLDDGGLYLYCSPAMYSSLLKSDDFSHANLRGDGMNPLSSGVIGTIYGAQVVASSLWDNATLSADEVEATLFHSSSTGVAFSIEPNVKAQENIAYLSTDLVASCCYGAGVINGDLISNIKV